MLFNEFTSDLSEQEIYLMKQVLNSINDKVGQLDTDVAELKKAPELIESGELDGTVGTVSIEHGLANAEDVLVIIETVVDSSKTTTTADIMIFDGQTQIAAGSIGNAIMVNARRSQLHFNKLTDDNFYHVDYGSVGLGATSQPMTQGNGGIGHFKGDFDKISVALQGGATFPVGTKYYVYVK